MYFLHLHLINFKMTTTKNHLGGGGVSTFKIQVLFMEHKFLQCSNFSICMQFYEDTPPPLHGEILFMGSNLALQYSGL